VTSVGRGIPLSFSLCSNDVQGTYTDFAPLCQKSRAESEYFKDTSYPGRAPLLPMRGLPSDPHFAKSLRAHLRSARENNDFDPAVMERPRIRTESAQKADPKRRKARRSEFSQKCQDIDGRLAQFLAERQETTAVVDDVVPGPSAGPVLHLSKPGAMYSNVNDDCRDILTPTT